MASKAHAFDVLLPKLNRADDGVIFAAGNYIRRSGVVPADLQACRLQGGSIGVHVAAIGATHTLCTCTLTSQTGKDAEPNVAASTEAKASRESKAAAHKRVAASTTCKFCAARLIAAGVITAAELPVSMPQAWRAYAADYGTRGNAESQLAEIEARAAEAAAAAAAAATPKPKRAPKPKAETPNANSAERAERARRLAR